MRLPRIGPGSTKHYYMPKIPNRRSAVSHHQLHKCPTGIKGFDEITEGGLPKNRTTLFSGSTGTGKTLLGIDFLINGASRYDERASSCPLKRQRMNSMKTWLPST